MNLFELLWFALAVLCGVLSGRALYSRVGLPGAILGAIIGFGVVAAILFAIRKFLAPSRK